MLNSVEQTKPIMQLSVTLGSVPACWAKERAKARDRSDPTLAAWHCWETKVQRSYLECVVWDAEACVGSLEPDTQARRCQLLCPILRAFMRKDLGNNFLCHLIRTMYGRWGDSDSSLIKRGHFIQWNCPKPPWSYLMSPMPPSSQGQQGSHLAGTL